MADPMGASRDHRRRCRAVDLRLRENHSEAGVLTMLKRTIIAILVNVIPLLSQTFDVASVKPAAPGSREGLAIQPGGRLVVNGLPLRFLIALAYHLRAFQMVGGESWMTDDRWSIEAKTNASSSAPPSSPQNI